MSFNNLFVKGTLTTKNLCLDGKLIEDILEEKLGISQDLNLRSLTISEGLIVESDETSFGSVTCKGIKASTGVEASRVTAKEVKLKLEDGSLADVQSIQDVVCDGSQLHIKYHGGHQVVADLSSLCDNTKVVGGTMSSDYLQLDLSDGESIKIDIANLVIDQNTYLKKASMDEKGLLNLSLNDSSVVSFDTKTINKLQRLQIEDDLECKKILIQDEAHFKKGCKLTVGGAVIDSSLLDARLKGVNGSILSLSLSNGRSIEQSLRGIKTDTGVSKLALDETNSMLNLELNSGLSLKVDFEDAVNRVLKNCKHINAASVLSGGKELSSKIESMEVDDNASLRLKTVSGEIIAADCSKLTANGVSGKYTDNVTGEYGLILNSGERIPLLAQTIKNMHLEDSLSVGETAIVTLGAAELSMTNPRSTNIKGCFAPICITCGDTKAEFGNSILKMTAKTMQLESKDGISMDAAVYAKGNLPANTESLTGDPQIALGLIDSQPVINLYYNYSSSDKNSFSGIKFLCNKQEETRKSSRKRRNTATITKTSLTGSILSTATGTLSIGSASCKNQVVLEGSKKGQEKTSITGSLYVNGAKVSREVNGIDLRCVEGKDTPTLLALQCSDKSEMKADLSTLKTNHDIIQLDCSASTGQLSVKKVDGTVLATDLTVLPNLSVEGPIKTCASSLTINSSIDETKGCYVNAITSTRELCIKTGSAASPSELSLQLNLAMLAGKSTVLQGDSIFLRASSACRVDSNCLQIKPTDTSKCANLVLSSDQVCSLYFSGSDDSVSKAGFEYEKESNCFYAGTDTKAPSICISGNGNVDIKRGLTVGGCEIKHSVLDMSFDDKSLKTKFTDGSVIETGLDGLIKDAPKSVFRRDDSLVSTTFGGNESTVADLSEINKLHVKDVLRCGSLNALKSICLEGFRDSLTVNQKATRVEWTSETKNSLIDFNLSSFNVTSTSARMTCNNLTLSSDQVIVPNGSKFTAHTVCVEDLLRLPVISSASELDKDVYTEGCVAFSQTDDCVIIKTARGVGKIRVDYD